jgi:formyl-CoA transferase
MPSAPIDPQVRHLGLARAVRHPALGDVQVIDNAVGMSRTPCDLNRATPECGEHTEEILAELGLEAQELAELRAAGAV